MGEPIPWFNIFNLIISFVGLLGGIPHIFQNIEKPNIRLLDVQLNRYESGPSQVYDNEGQVIGVEHEPESFRIQWILLNDVNWFFFGKDVLDFRVKWNLSNVDTTRYSWDCIDEPERYPNYPGSLQKISPETQHDKTSIWVQVKGRLVDIATQAPVSGAQVIIGFAEDEKSLPEKYESMREFGYYETQSNLYGNFQMKTHSGEQWLHVMAKGYQTWSGFFDLKDETITLEVIGLHAVL